MVRHLPAPSGSYSVGYTDVVNKYGAGGLLMRLFYPIDNTDKVDNKFMEDYNYVKGLGNFLGMPSFIVNFFVSDLRIWAHKNAPPSLPLEKCAVTVFSHGLGGNRLLYSTKCLELASHGMVVAAVEHSDESASATHYLAAEEPHEKVWVDYLKGVDKLKDPEDPAEENPKDPQKPNKSAKAPKAFRNKQVLHRARSCTEALNILETINCGSFEPVSSGVDLLLLKGRLDVERCAIAGHSFGGATVMATLADDHRFKVGVGLDVWTFPLNDDIYQKLQRNVPILFVNTGSFQWPENLAGVRKMDADTCPGSVDRPMVTTVGTVHQSQSDTPFFTTNAFLAKKIRLRGDEEPLRATQLDNSLMMGFIGKHLGLPFAKEIEDLVKSMTGRLYYGSAVELDEERIKEAKERLCNPKPSSL